MTDISTITQNAVFQFASGVQHNPGFALGTGCLLLTLPAAYYYTLKSGHHFKKGDAIQGLGYAVGTIGELMGTTMGLYAVGELMKTTSINKLKELSLIHFLNKKVYKASSDIVSNTNDFFKYTADQLNRSPRLA